MGILSVFPLMGLNSAVYMCGCPITPLRLAVQNAVLGIQLPHHDAVVVLIDREQAMVHRIEDDVPADRCSGH